MSNSLRFEWAGDVVGDKGKSWRERWQAKELQRSCLCNHVHDLVWQQAISSLHDAVLFPRGSAWMTVLKKVEPEAFTSFMRAEVSKIYSELSKGIHHEFVIPIQYQFDQSTMESLFDRVWTWTGNMSVVACHSNSLHRASLSPIEAYEEAQRELYT